MRRKKEVEEVEEVKNFHLPASVRLYPAHTKGAARHGDNVLEDRPIMQERVILYENS